MIELKRQFLVESENDKEKITEEKKDRRKS